MSPALWLAGNEGHLADISVQECTAHLWVQLRSSGRAGAEGRGWIVDPCRRRKGKWGETEAPAQILQAEVQTAPALPSQNDPGAEKEPALT